MESTLQSPEFFTLTFSSSLPVHPFCKVCILHWFSSDIIFRSYVVLNEINWELITFVDVKHVKLCWHRLEVPTVLGKNCRFVNLMLRRVIWSLPNLLSCHIFSHFVLYWQPCYIAVYIYTARELLDAVRKGKLSGSVWFVSSLGEEHSVVDSWFLVRFMYLQPFSCDDIDAAQPFSRMDDTFRCFSFNCTACQKTHIMCSLQLDSTSWCMMNQRKFECHTLRRWTRD